MEDYWLNNSSLYCAFSKETQSYCLGQTKFEPQSIRNNGMNRLSCFRCDHDICDRYDIKLLKLDCNTIYFYYSKRWSQINFNVYISSCVRRRLYVLTRIVASSTNPNNGGLHDYQLPSNNTTMFSNLHSPDAGKIY